MNCPRCAGSGRRVICHEPMVDYSSGPCPECQGSGIVSCCDTAGAHMTEESLLAAMRKIREDFRGSVESKGKRLTSVVDLRPEFIKDDPYCIAGRFPSRMQRLADSHE
jgi:hypothetical protein